jgi:hypothetical protein
MEVPSDTPVHRIGGAAIDNLRLKPHEARAVPVGISVLLGGTPAEIAAQARVTFERMPRLCAQTSTIATATVGAIRSVGFDVLADPTRLLSNHGRLVHPDGVTGFSDEHLTRLAQVFKQTEGC